MKKLILVFFLALLIGAAWLYGADTYSLRITHDDYSIHVIFQEDDWAWANGTIVFKYPAGDQVFYARTTVTENGTPSTGRTKIELVEDAARIAELEARLARAIEPGSPEAKKISEVLVWVAKHWPDLWVENLIPILERLEWDPKEGGMMSPQYVHYQLSDAVANMESRRRAIERGDRKLRKLRKGEEPMVNGMTIREAEQADRIAMIPCLVQAEVDRLREELQRERDSCEYMAENIALRARLETMTQAVELATKIHPCMEMNADDPIGMMQEVASHVDSLRARLESCWTRLDAMCVKDWRTIAVRAEAEIERLREELDDSSQWIPIGVHEVATKQLADLRARLEGAIDLNSLDLYQTSDGQYVAALLRNGEWIRATGTNARPALEALQARIAKLRGDE